MATKKTIKTLDIWNKRMLSLMKHCIDTNECSTQKEFLESIDFEPTNLRQIKVGTQGFTMKHFVNAARQYSINMNWFVGLESEMKRQKGKSKSPLIQLKEALKSLETEMK